jgi:hypothetical protein
MGKTGDTGETRAHAASLCHRKLHASAVRARQHLVMIGWLSTHPTRHQVSWLVEHPSHSPPGVMTKEVTKALSYLSMRVTVPALLFTSVLPAVNAGLVRRVWPMFFFPGIYAAMGAFFGWLVIVFCNPPEDFRRGTIAAVAFGNSTGNQLPAPRPLLVRPAPSELRVLSVISQGCRSCYSRSSRSSCAVCAGRSALISKRGSRNPTYPYHTRTLPCYTGVPLPCSPARRLVVALEGYRHQHSQPRDGRRPNCLP